jgi:hypothetical protein
MRFPRSRITLHRVRKRNEDLTVHEYGLEKEGD